MVRFKRGLAILLSTCMIGGIMPIQARAEDTGFGIETQTKAAELGDDVYAKKSTESNSWLEVSSAENKYKTMDYTASDGNTYKCYVYSSTEYNAVLISVEQWSSVDRNGKETYDEQIEELASKGARMPKFEELQILVDAGTVVKKQGYNCQEYQYVSWEDGKWYIQEGDKIYPGNYYNAVFELNRNPIKTVSTSPLIKNDNSSLSTVKGVDFAWQGECDIKLSYYNSDKIMLDSAPVLVGDYYVKVSTPVTQAAESGNTVRYEASESDYIPFTIVHDLEKHEAVSPTCIQEGQEAYWTCRKCDKLFSDENGENEITEPVKIPVIQHDYTYKVISDTNDTIQAVCDVCDDAYTVKLVAPTGTDGKLTYTGTGLAVRTEITDGTLEEALPEIEYASLTGDTESAYSTDVPKNAGNYRAKLTLGSDDNVVSATVDYTIAKAVPVISWSDAQKDQSAVYTGEAIDSSKITAPTIALLNGETFSATDSISYSYRKLIEGTASGTFISGLPTETGTYEIKAAIPTVGNYSSAETTATMQLTVKQAANSFTTALSCSGYAYAKDETPKPNAKAKFGTVTYKYAKTDSDGNAPAADSVYTDVIPVNAGTYAVKAYVAETDNYAGLASDPVVFTIVKAAKAPNMPGTTMAPAHSTKKVGDITLPEGWNWSDNDKDTALTDGVAVTATAVYTGADKGNYETESVIITITRSECDHTHTEIRNQQEATCKNEGYTGDTYCADCGEKLATGTATEKKPHTVGTPAICVSKAVCSVCSETFGEVDATNHVHTTVKNRKEATCIQTGYTGDTYCMDCDKLLETGKELAALEHDYKATVTKQPTTTEEGVRTYTCTRCNSSYTESIAKLPEEQHTHNYTGSITKEATCTEAGVRTYTCSCGDSYTESIPATGHSYVSKVTKAATTTEEGIMTYTCSKCGHSYAQTIAKIKIDNGNSIFGQKTETGNGTAKNNIGENNADQNTSANQNIQSDSDTETKPYIKDDSGKEGWDVIKSQLEDAKPGDTVTVAMNGTTVVPKNIFDRIKGKDTTLVLDMGNGLSWKINGKDITDAAGDIDFGVTVGADAGKSIPVDVINSLTGGRSSMNLTLAYDGEFGFTATLTVNMEAKNAGLYANLFYYNEQNGQFEFVSAGQIDVDGNAELAFTHASDYTIVIDTAVMNDENEEIVTSTESTETSGDETIQASKEDDVKADTWNPIIIIIGICIVLAALGAVVFIRKKSHSEEK